MTRIRAFEKADIPAVAALRSRCFQRSEQHDHAGLIAYMAEVFFGNPWYDEELPCLVAEGAGRIVGFLGVVPRRMTAHGRPLRVATTTQFMVAPGAPPSVGAQLLRTLFAGPQDASLADVASPAARSLWEAVGGMTAAPSSLTWAGLLRPLRHVITKVAGRGRLARLTAAVARPFEPLVTRAFGNDRLAAPRQGIRLPMSDAELRGCLAQPLDGRAIRGHYDAASLAWLLEMLQRRQDHGPLRRARVVDARGALLGWYVYHASAGDSGRVVHLAALPRAGGVVLDHLLVDAADHGCTAVSGRFDLRLAGAMAERRALVFGSGTWVLVHARDAELRAAFARDEATLTRLDGEWWMAF